MLAGDFYRKLKQLNKDLRIYCGDWDTRPAGIFYVERGEYQEVCGIDKHFVPEYAIMAPHGAHIKGGYRRALRILAKRGLIDVKEAERLFRTKLHFKNRKVVKRDNSIPARRIG